jgi:branched-chain amino acid transport system permease protein
MTAETPVATASDTPVEAEAEAPAPGGTQFTVKVTNRANRWIAAAGIVVLVVLIMFPFYGGTPWTRSMIEFLTILALAEFWNMMMGYAGIISVGQQGYIGIGAYALWLLSDQLNINPFVAVIIAAVGGAIIALPSAALVFKLRGGYLAIGTWVIAEILRLIMTNINSAGGNSGVSIQSPLELGVNVWITGTYWWALGAALLSIFVTYFLLRSRTGLALKSIRDDDLAAESLGVNLWRTKLYTFVIAGAGSALTGAIVALSLLRVQPSAAFSLNWMAEIIFIVIIGGVGTIEGPIIGAVLYFILLKTTASYGEWYYIVLGSVAIVVAVVSPQGIYGYIVQKTGFMIFPVQRKVRFMGGSEPAEAVPGSGRPGSWLRSRLSGKATGAAPSVETTAAD